MSSNGNLALSSENGHISKAWVKEKGGFYFVVFYFKSKRTAEKQESVGGAFERGVWRGKAGPLGRAARGLATSLEETSDKGAEIKM